MSKLHARLLEYRDHLLCESLTFHTIEGQCVRPDVGAKGCVTFQTEKYLGASREALDLMKTVKVGKEEIGNIAWFDHGPDGAAFAWLGGLCVAMDPATIEAAATFAVHEHLCVLVPNEVSGMAKHFVDDLITTTAQQKQQMDAAEAEPKAIWSSDGE